MIRVRSDLAYIIQEDGQSCTHRRGDRKTGEENKQTQNEMKKREREKIWVQLREERSRRVREREVGE